MLELASLLLDFRLAFERQTVREQPLRQPMPPNDIRRPLPSTRRQFNHHTSVSHGKPRRF